jgi:hypothetical protein
LIQLTIEFFFRHQYVSIPLVSGCWGKENSMMEAVKLKKISGLALVHGELNTSAHFLSPDFSGQHLPLDITCRV